ncbi:MAG: hypothetical protein CMP38_06985 [Rickettsiales bacterium]|nr:hypothetical protein [Rickettsiales bacterium]
MFSNVRIEKLILSNYRNHKFLELELKKNIILICGKNGSGKTNILESISLLTSSSGIKKTNLIETVNSNLKGPVELFGVNLLCNINNKKMKIGLGLKKNANGLKKIINLEGLKTNKKIDEYFSIFWISPRMTFLFQNSKEERRSFIDQMICSIDFSFKKFLLQYEKYKSERIKILKKWNETSEEWLSLVERKLAATGIIICDARRKFIKQLNFNLSELDRPFHSLKIGLSGELDSLLLKKPAIEVEDFFLKKLKENRRKDILTGKTNFSANKTDLIVLNENYDREAKNHSTGEQKVIIFLIIFSFMKILKNQKDLKVIFLLDDVFSFLDKNFVLRVLDELNKLKIQTWLTDVSGDWIMKKESFKSIIHKINIDE